MWRAVVLSSGGVLGEFQVGALDELKRRVPSVDLWCGAGVGALNATTLAMDTDLSSAVDSVITLWDEEILDNDSVFKAGLFGVPGGVLGALISEGPHASLGAIDPRPTRQLIEKHSRWDVLGGRKNWAVATVSLTDSQLYAVTNDPALLARTKNVKQRVSLSLDPNHPHFLGAHLHDFVQAAAAVPLMFPPVDLFGHRFCEAGIRDYTPWFLAGAGLEAAAGGDPGFEAEVIVIDTSGAELHEWGKDKLDSGREIALRSMQVMISEMSQNDAALGLARLRAAAPKVKVKVIKPPLEFEGFTMDFGDLSVREGLRKLGVERAQAVL